MDVTHSAAACCVLPFTLPATVLAHIGDTLTQLDHAIILAASWPLLKPTVFHTLGIVQKNLDRR